jgi:peptide chain release factor 1
MTEVRIERTTSTGPVGSLNTTYSAIKYTTEPTGMIVSCQDQKSSHKNLEKSLKGFGSSRFV